MGVCYQKKKGKKTSPWVTNGGEGTGSRGTTFLGPHGVWGEDPPGPTTSAYGHPKMEKGVERISFVLPPKAATFFLAYFFCSNPKGWGEVGWGGGTPSPQDPNKKRLPCFKNAMLVPRGEGPRLTGRASKNNAALDNTQIKIVHRRGKNSKTTTNNKQRDPVLLLKTKQKQHLF